MFELLDGRSEFYQWDSDRQIIVKDESITQLHFCNRTDECSLCVEVVDGIANVPNILLQDSWNIKVYGFDKNYTKHCETFKVVARSKPSDYIYTETEVKNYEDLKNRVDEIEKNGISDERIGIALESYLEENPIEVEVDLSEYATTEYVDNAVNNIDIPEVDLTGYATEKYVDEAISNIEVSGGSDIDLSEYAKKTDIPDVSSFITEVPEEYVTETELNAKGYLTEHQSLEGYATEEYVNTAIENIEVNGGSGVATDELFIINAQPKDATLSSLVFDKTYEETMVAILGGAKVMMMMDLGVVQGTLDFVINMQGVLHFGGSSAVENTLTYYGVTWNGTDSTFVMGDSANFATKDYVNDAISNIDVSGGGSGLSEEDVNNLIQSALSNIGVAEEGVY